MNNITKELSKSMLQSSADEDITYVKIFGITQEGQSK